MNKRKQHKPAGGPSPPLPPPPASGCAAHSVVSKQPVADTWSRDKHPVTSPPAVTENEEGMDFGSDAQQCILRTKKEGGSYGWNDHGTQRPSEARHEA